MRKSILLTALASVALMFSMAASAADHFKPAGFDSIPAVQGASKDGRVIAPAAAVAVHSIKAVTPGVSLNAAQLSAPAHERPASFLTAAAQPSFVLRQTGTHADRAAEDRGRGKFAI